MNHTGVVVLAAGESRRMGTPKALLPWGNRSVIEHVIEQWKAPQVAQIAVVCAPENARLGEELNRIGFPSSQRILNHTRGGDMFSSIRCAAAWPGWIPSLTQWVVTLADQPHLRADTLRSLVDCAKANPNKVCQPRYGGRRRHPVLLPGTLFEELSQTSAVDLKEFLDRHGNDLAAFDSDDPGLALDMDTPADYTLLKERFWPDS